QHTGQGRAPPDFFADAESLPHTSTGTQVPSHLRPLRRRVSRGTQPSQNTTAPAVLVIITAPSKYRHTHIHQLWWVAFHVELRQSHVLPTVKGLAGVQMATQSTQASEP